MPPELETVDLDGVEILSAGGPYHGAGSPKNGDYFTADFLSSLAAANSALTEVRPPIKIGHNTSQKLLLDSGLSPDEMPAAGWLANIRTGEGADGKAKLLADFKAVPAKLAALMKSGAFRTRSVEMGRVVAQSGEKAGEKLTAITALALLGAKAPAVRTLDDIVALYSDEGIDEEMGDLSEIVVADNRDVVEGEMVLQFADKEWIAPYRVWGDDDVIELSERALWREKKEDVMGSQAPADTGGMTIKELSDEQIRTLAATLGLGDEIEGDELRSAVADKMVDLVGKEVEKDGPASSGDTASTNTLSDEEIAALRADVGLARALSEERRIEKRDALIDAAVQDGKIAPAEAATWRSLYDANQQAASDAVSKLPVNDDLVRAFGRDGDGEDGSGNDDSKAEDEMYREFAGMLGLPAEEA